MSQSQARGRGVRLEGKRLDEYNQAFVIYESQGCGKATKEQAANIIRAIGLSPSNEEMNQMLSDRSEFDQRTLHNIITTLCPHPESEEALREAFRTLDKEGAGYVDCREMRHVLEHLGEKLTPEQVDELIRELDTNGSNQISCDEFVHTMMSLA